MGIILAIICTVLFFVWLFFKTVIRSILLSRFRRKVEPILPDVDKQIDVFNNMFKPDRLVPDEEIEKFINENESLRSQIEQLYTPKPTIFNEYLDSTCIKPYLEQITRYNVTKRQQENNQAHENIERLKFLSTA